MNGSFGAGTVVFTRSRDLLMPNLQVHLADSSFPCSFPASCCTYQPTWTLIWMSLMFTVILIHHSSASSRFFPAPILAWHHGSKGRRNTNKWWGDPPASNWYLETLPGHSYFREKSTSGGGGRAKRAALFLGPPTILASSWHCATFDGWAQYSMVMGRADNTTQENGQGKVSKGRDTVGRNTKAPLITAS